MNWDGAGRLRRFDLPLRVKLALSFALLLGLTLCLTLLALSALSQVYHDLRPLSDQPIPRLAAEAHYLQARQSLVLLADAIMALGLFLALLLCTALGRGLEKITEAAERLAAGQDPGLDFPDEPDRPGIAGRLAVALIRQAAVQRDIINLAESIGSGDLPAHPLRRCAEDPLGTALESMVLALTDMKTDRRLIAAEAREEVLRLGTAIKAAKADARQVSDGFEPAIATLDRLALSLSPALPAGINQSPSQRPPSQLTALSLSLFPDDPVLAFARIAQRICPAETPNAPDPPALTDPAKSGHTRPTPPRSGGMPET